MADELTLKNDAQPVITTDPGVCRALAGELAQSKSGSVIRVELTSTGCCDASLGLRVDKPDDDDIDVKIEGLTFVVSRKTYDLVGQIRIAQRNNAEFVLTSEKPVSEWDGFGSCKVRL